jgi:hypothetical protein
VRKNPRTGRPLLLLLLPLLMNLPLVLHLFSVLSLVFPQCVLVLLLQGLQRSLGRRQAILLPRHQLLLVADNQLQLVDLDLQVLLPMPRHHGLPAAPRPPQLPLGRAVADGPAQAGQLQVPGLVVVTVVFTLHPPPPPLQSIHTREMP